MTKDKQDPEPTLEEVLQAIDGTFTITEMQIALRVAAWRQTGIEVDGNTVLSSFGYIEGAVPEPPRNANLRAAYWRLINRRVLLITRRVGGGLQQVLGPISRWRPAEQPEQPEPIHPYVVVTKPLRPVGASRKKESGPKGSSQSSAPARPVYDEEFEACWALYPRRPGDSKAAAFKAWKSRRKEGATPAELIAGTQKYARYIAARESAGDLPSRTLIKMGATFYGPGRHYEADYEDASPAYGVGQRWERKEDRSQPQTTQKWDLNKNK